MTSPLFLPWLRRGLARGIGEVDPGTGDLSPRTSVEAAVTVADDVGGSRRLTSPMTLLGPGDVTGLDSSQIVRREPPDGATDVEANYLPHVELLLPDLPWLLTPARPGGNEALRPWLALICVEADLPGVEVDLSARPCPVLRLDAATAALELPDLDESWAWAHVHSLVPPPRVAAEVEAGRGAVTSRIMSPRRLREGRRYRAALVPAFDAGRDAGLGRPVDPDATRLAPAWDLEALPELVELPMYSTWTFTTSAVPGDFEDLCLRLQPDTDGGRLGYRASRIVNDGLLEPYRGDTGFEYEGALVDPDSRGQNLDDDARAWFSDGMTTRLQQAASRRVVDAEEPDDYVPERDDPVVGPPFYGSWAADRFTVPNGGWLREVNLRPDRRAAAGLGARLVTLHQTELLAAAWDQAGEVRALRDELNRGRLAAEIGRSHARRLGTLDDPSLLQATGRLHTFVRTGRRTAVEALTASVVMPSAMVSAALRRHVRPGSTVGRRFAVANPDSRLTSLVTGAFVEASAPLDVRPAAAEPCARFGAGFVPHGGVTTWTVFAAAATVDPPIGLPVPHRSVPSTPIDDDAPLIAVEPVAVVRTSARDDVRTVATDVRDQLDPMPAIVAQLSTRTDGIVLDPARDLPTRIAIGARFDTPLAPWLVALGADLLVPGVHEMANNRARMLAVNEAAVAALLVGANHEWAREALYHEYPADLGATSFDAFWEAVVTDRADLADDIHTWPLDTSLADHVGGAGGSTVLLVRGDVIRRYPNCEFLLVEPDADGEILAGNVLPADRVTRPTFAATLDPGTVVIGFDVDPDIVLDGGWYLGIEEPASGPRFGLDVADAADHGRTPSTWDDLSWGHVSSSPADLEAATQLTLGHPTWLAGHEIAGTTWGRNAAHVAASLFQRPFRLLFPAAHLLRRAQPRRHGGKPS